MKPSKSASRKSRKSTKRGRKSRNGRTSNEDTLTFKGDSELLILDLGYTIKRKNTPF